MIHVRTRQLRQIDTPAEEIAASGASTQYTPQTDHGYAPPSAVVGLLLAMFTSTMLVVSMLVGARQQEARR